MILQCDQCNTKFRLDDAKLKPGGVKVRCSKCRHVFLAGAEVKHEESEFDAILSGLGAPLPEKPEEAVAPVAGGDATGFAFDDERDTAKSPAFVEEIASQHEEDDFTAFDFPAEPVEPDVPQEKPAQVTPDFGAFDLAPEVHLEQEAQASAGPQGLDYGEFAFDEEPAALKEEPAFAPDQILNFGEFSFPAEPAVGQEDPVTAATAGLDFNDFDFEEPADKLPAPLAPDDVDYREFSFATDDAPPIVVPEVAANEAFDFAEFSIAAEPVNQLAHAAAEPNEAPVFGELSFAEEMVQPKETSAPAADFSELDSFSFPEDLQPNEEEAAPQEDGAFGFGEFTFSQDLAEKPAVDAPPADKAAATPPSADVGPHGSRQSLSTATETPKSFNGEAALDFGFATGPASTRVPEEDEGEEVLPFLSIVSRRKGRSLITISVVLLSALIIVALSGAGLYLMQSGPAAFDKLGLGFVAKWFGMESAEEGRIVIRNPQAAFYQNKEAGEIFVVTGEAVNSFRMARASIHVKVSLFDKNGKVLLQKTAYCGNRLPMEQLTTLPMEKIESILSNPFGDSLANLGVQPDSAIGFVVAIANVPKEAADFGVEVLGSTVAGK